MNQSIAEIEEDASKSWLRKIIEARDDKEAMIEIKRVLSDARQIFTVSSFASPPALHLNVTNFSDSTSSGNTQYQQGHPCQRTTGNGTFSEILLDAYFPYL